MTIKTQRILGKRTQLCKQLTGCTDMLRGTLVIKYLKCGRPGCRCGKGSPHGPKYYLSDKYNGVTRMLYVPADTIAAVRKQIALHHFGAMINYPPSAEIKGPFPSQRFAHFGIDKPFLLKDRKGLFSNDYMLT